MLFDLNCIDVFKILFLIECFDIVRDWDEDKTQFLGDLRIDLSELVDTNGKNKNEREGVVV
jgi:hypothetical protein